MASTQPKIIVVGSLNVDHVFRVEKIPAPGETLTARSGFTCFGGKGANQALAASRAGGAVTMIGCVGPDDFGNRYTEHLSRESIVTSGIVTGNSPTGSAFICVDDRGENCIVVNPGSNHELSPQHIDSKADLIRASDILLLQLECPLPVVRRAAEIARAAGVKVVLNPSPWNEELRGARFPVDVIVVNEHEAAALTGRSLDTLMAAPEAALREAQCELLIVTRGGEETLSIHQSGEVVRVKPLPVTPVDTVGAGDSFTGALAVALGEGRSVFDRLDFANAAGALATLVPGAQPAMPTRDAILQFLDNRP